MAATTTYTFPVEQKLPYEIIQFKDPNAYAVGNSPYYTVPAGEIWEIISFTAQVTTDATVINRLVTLASYFNANSFVNNNILNIISNNAVQPPSNTYGHIFSSNIQSDKLLPNKILTSIRDRILLGANNIISLNIINIQAGDVVDSHILTYKKYLII